MLAVCAKGLPFDRRVRPLCDRRPSENGTLAVRGRAQIRPTRDLIGAKVSPMKLSGIDANLLAALDALLREKSVTRAARRLGVGQPALSHSLALLRDHFKDELLVLKGRNYVLTSKAENLLRVVANATRALAEV